MADPRELLSGSQASGARAHDGHFFACLFRGWQRFDPALSPAFVNDRVFDGLDADRVVIDIQGASGLAGCGTNAAGEFRKVVGAVQNRERVLPVVVEHQVVEIGNDVVDWATAVAKRRAAIHASRALCFGLVSGQANDKFLVMLQTLGHGFVTLFNAFELHESSDFSHDVSCVFGLRLDSGFVGFGGRGGCRACGGCHVAQSAFVFVGEDLDKLGPGL